MEIVNFFEKIEKLKIELLKQLSTSLKNHIASQNFDRNMVILEQKKSDQINILFDTLNKQKNKYFNNIKQNIEHVNNINYSLDVLHELQKQHNDSSIIYLKNNLVNLNNIFNQLLFEHNLVERQINFLKELVISYAQTANLTQTTHKLIKIFHDYFPFYFISICSTNENSEILLQIYFTQNISTQTTKYIIITLKETIYQQHGIIIKDQNITHEVLLDNSKKNKLVLKKIHIISMPLFQDESLDATKILAISCAISTKLSDNEINVTKTNLSIMGISLNTNINLLSDYFLKTKHHATHDSLTELYNRHYFDKIMSYEIKRSQKDNGKFSVLMIDLDDFKNINDSHGHAIGDNVLKNVATTLLSSIRKSDLATRIGGDEFAVILMDTDLNQASIVAETIRKNIQKMILLTTKQEEFHISVSIGISNYPGTAQDPLGLMSNMDIALYKAKTAGKNIVATFKKP